MENKKEKIKRRFNSVGMKVFLVALLMSVIPFTLASFHFMVRGTILSTREANKKVYNMGEMVAGRLSNIDIYSSLTEEMMVRIDQIAEVMEGRVLILDLTRIAVYDSHETEKGNYITGIPVSRVYKGENVRFVDNENDYSGYIMPIYRNETGLIQGILIIAYDYSGMLGIQENLGYEFITWGIAVIFAMLMLSMLLAYRMAYPFKMLTEHMRLYAEGRTDIGFKIKGSTEVSDMEKAIEDMLDEMKREEKKRQDFVSSVSHELKTPLTSMKLLAESIVQSKDVPKEMYLEFFEDVNSEVNREVKIIEDLLNLVKLSQEDEVMQITHVNLNAMIEGVLKRIEPIADNKKVELIFESFRPVKAELDETKFWLALTNLIENAVKYNKPNGHVWVSLDADHKYFVLRVRDDGIGIPESDRRYVFDKFYRVDKARSRETGGTGLGLAIVRDVVTLHHGAIKIHDGEKGGVEFKLRIPLKYNPDEEPTPVFLLKE